MEGRVGTYRLHGQRSTAMADVRISKAAGLQWLVLLEGVVVGKFVIATEALDYAALLECDPRERDLALAS
jgi:hypothetical protein